MKAVLLCFVVWAGCKISKAQFGQYFGRFSNRRQWENQAGDFGLKLDLNPPIEQSPFNVDQFDEVSGTGSKFGLPPSIPMIPAVPEQVSGNRNQFGLPPPLPFGPQIPEFMPLDHYRRVFIWQLVDHFNREADLRWRHPYYIDLSMMENGAGPIFLEIGAEFDIAKHFEITKTPFNEFSKDLAIKYKAAQFSLQHRYYAPDAFPVKNGTLAQLSSEQAMADIAYFIESVIRNELKLTGPIIVGGCSYGGSLAVWFRTKYHHVVAGAIAKSPVLVAKLQIPEYTEHVENIARKMYPDCLRDMGFHIPRIRKVVQDKPEEFLRKMNICDWSKIGAKKILTRVMLEYTSKFMGFAQRGYNETLKGKNLIGDKFCPLLRFGDIYGAMRSVLSNSLKRYTCPSYLYESCMDVDVLFDMRKLEKTCKPTAALTQTDSNSDMWNWQKCTEFGWFMTVPNNQSVFKFYTMQEHMELFCHNASIDEVASHVKHTNAIYGGLNLQGATKVLIIDGEHDPWRLLSMPPTGFFKPNGVSSYMVQDANHCPKAAFIVEKGLTSWLK